jgi:hypothetical protein
MISSFVLAAAIAAKGLTADEWKTVWEGKYELHGTSGCDFKSPFRPLDFTHCSKHVDVTAEVVKGKHPYVVTVLPGDRGNKIGNVRCNPKAKYQLESKSASSALDLTWHLFSGFKTVAVHPTHKDGHLLVLNFKQVGFPGTSLLKNCQFQYKKVVAVAETSSTAAPTSIEVTTTSSSATETQTATESPAATETQTATESPAASETQTASESSTASETQTATESSAATGTQTATESPAASETQTATASPSGTETQTSSATQTNTEAPSSSASVYPTQPPLPTTVYPTAAPYTEKPAPEYVPEPKAEECEPAEEKSEKTTYDVLSGAAIASPLLALIGFAMVL